MAVIYRIVCVVTDHFYVGSALKPKRRRWEHWDMLNKKMHHCAALQSAWNTYGADAFEFEILEEVQDETAVRSIEDIYLCRYAGTPECYNTAKSTKIAVTLQPEVSSKISASLKRYYAKNPHPRLGAGMSEETKAKIRANRVPPSGEKHYLYGKTVPDDVRKKIGDTQRGVAKGPRTYTDEGLAKARENMKRNAVIPIPLEFEIVKAKFPAEVLNKYDFSNAVYTSALARIQHCNCPIHGEFSQYSAQFRKGRGCPRCGEVERRQSRRQTYANRKQSNKIDLT